MDIHIFLNDDSKSFWSRFQGHNLHPQETGLCSLFAYLFFSSEQFPVFLFNVRLVTGTPELYKKG